MMKKGFLALLLSVLMTSLSAQVTFQPMDTLAFLQDVGYLRGLSWVDVDNDNDLDISVSGITGNFPDFENVTAIFLNQGNFFFQNTGLIQSDQANPMGHGWADIENDGDLDVYFGATWNAGGVNELWLNEGTSFIQVTNSGATPNTPLPFEGNVSWGDYDNDGFVDLFLARWNNSANKLYRNQGDGTFAEITSIAPVATAAWTSAGIWGDYDNDRDLDLYVVNYQIGSTNPGTNELYQNNGDGTFTQIANAGDAVTDAANSRTANWVDYDNDGWLDLFVANQNSPDRIYRNNGDGTFTGTDLGSSSTSWSSNWGDYDNDGDPDLFVMGFFGTDSHFWQNEGDGLFTDISGQYPNILPTQTNGSNSNAVMFVDADQDGWLDLHLAQPNTSPDRFFHNQGDGCKTWLAIKCIGSTTNWAGIGTMVRLKANLDGQSVWQTQQVSAQTSKPGQNPQWLHFGLDTATEIDSLVIEWPSGTTCVFTDLLPSRLIEVIESDCSLTTLVPTPTIGGSLTTLDLCGDVLLEPTGPSGGFWFADCGNCVDGMGNFSPAGLDPGDYEVLYRVMDPCGLQTDTFQITVLGGSAGTNTNVEWCEGAPAADLTSLLEGSPTPGGQWVDVNFEPVPQPYQPITANETFFYLVDAGVCSDTATLVVNVVPGPDLAAQADPAETSPGTTVNLQASGADSYAWSPAGSLSCADCAEPVFNADTTTTFTLVGTAVNGCQDSVALTVVVSDKAFELPNIFTPDYDGTNDTFGPVFRTNPFSSIQFSIYNRWGELVFESNDPNVPWDGRTRQGDPYPMDTYYYQLNYEFSDGTTGQMSGEVTLIR
jgi:gliding motility-associated-like protein